MFLRVQKLTYLLFKLTGIQNKMSESQSRYSIVERLTQKKLNIITEKSNLDEDLKLNPNSVEVTP